MKFGHKSKPGFGNDLHMAAKTQVYSFSEFV